MERETGPDPEGVVSGAKEAGEGSGPGRSEGAGGEDDRGRAGVVASAGWLRSSPRPLTIAHRAGNDLALLRLAEEIGVDFVEADLWLYRGRLEVRHLKTIGPVPLLWDRWELASGRIARLELPALLETLRPGTGLLLDLKRAAPGLPDSLVAAFEPYRARPRRIMASSQDWRLLEALGRVWEVPLVYSVGNRRQLAALARRPLRHERGDHAIAIHQRLLTPAVLDVFKRQAPTVIPWAVNSEARLRELLAWGVDAINSDDFELLRRLVQGRH